MRNRLTLLGAMFALMFFHSCSDDVVNGVFVPEKEDVDREKSSLTVTLENLEITEGLVAGVLDRWGSGGRVKVRFVAPETCDLFKGGI